MAFNFGSSTTQPSFSFGGQTQQATPGNLITCLFDLEYNIFQEMEE